MKSLSSHLNENFQINENVNTKSQLENISTYIELSTMDKSGVFPKMDNNAQQLIDTILSSRNSISTLPIDSKYVDQILNVFDNKSFEGISKNLSLNSSDKNVTFDSKVLLDFIAWANAKSTLLEDIRQLIISGFIDTCKMYLDKHSIKYNIFLGANGLSFSIDSKRNNMSQEQFDELQNIIETKNYSFDVEGLFNMKKIFTLSTKFKYW
jgi:hypothetical protein